MVEKDGNIARPCILHQPQHRDQHHDRAEQCIKEEFIGRVNPVGAAPYPDNQVHRDQNSFKEYVKQENILGRKHTDHENFHDQESSHIFSDAVLYTVPARADTDRHQEHRQHDEQHGNAVYSKRPCKITEQVYSLNILPLRTTNIEIGPQHDTQNESHQRSGKCQNSGSLRFNKETDNGGQHRQRKHERQDWEIKLVHQFAPRTIIHVTAAASPINITSA